jgi:hypothetical protein
MEALAGDGIGKLNIENETGKGKHMSMLRHTSSVFHNRVPPKSQRLVSLVKRWLGGRRNRFEKRMQEKFCVENLWIFKRTDKLSRNVLEVLKKKRFDRGNCNCYGLIVPKSKIEGREDRRKPAVPRTNIIPSE